MSKEDAEREAVRQMGDPVETGCALNRIHRPAFPWKLFVLAVFLTGASMLISLTIDAKINEDGVQAAQVGSLFMVNAVSFAMIFVIMYFDYTWLFLHIRAVYALYMICLCLVWSGGILGNYQTALLASYSVQVLLPVIFAGIIYQYRGQGFRGILKSAGWIIIPFMVLTAGSFHCRRVMGRLWKMRGLSVPAGGICASWNIWKRKEKIPCRAGIACGWYSGGWCGFFFISIRSCQAAMCSPGLRIQVNLDIRTE